MSTVWRFSVEDPHTTQRQSFADLDALIAWLKTEVQDAPNPKPALAE